MSAPTTRPASDHVELYNRIDAAMLAARRILSELQELRASVAALPLPESRASFVCRLPHCRIVKRSEVALEEHYRNVHGLEPSEVPG